MKKWLLITCILGWLVFLIAAQETQELAQERISLFVGDTCMAPCWFGLTAGESDSADVEEMLEEHADIMGFRRTQDDESISDDALVINGWYEIFWPFRYVPTGIRIENGLVYYISAIPRYTNQTRISDTLLIYGQPDYIWLLSTSYCNILLLYMNYRIVIEFQTDFMDDVPSTGIVENDYELAEVVYYSPQRAIDSAEHYPPDIIDLYLNPPIANNLRQVPLETWEAWLNREDAYPCGDPAWSNLPEEIEAPVYPTLTPTPAF